jgi:hypothetical protein
MFPIFRQLVCDYQVDGVALYCPVMSPQLRRGQRGKWAIANGLAEVPLDFDDAGGGAAQDHSSARHSKINSAQDISSFSPSTKN